MTFRIKQQADAAEIEIFDVIGETFFGEGVTPRSIKKELDGLGPVARIDVLVNSGGGDFFDGLAIGNLFRQHPAQVTMKVLGLAASAAATIVELGGDVIEMAENSMMMIHKALFVTIGNADDHLKSAEILEKVDRDAAAIFAKRSGKSVDEILALFSDETWMTADEAVELGFADKVAEQADADVTEGLDKFMAVWKKAPEQTIKRVFGAKRENGQLDDPVAEQAKVQQKLRLMERQIELLAIEA